MTPTQAADLLERAALCERRARSDEALELLAGCEEWPFPYNEHGIVLRGRLLSQRDPIAALDSLPESVDAFVTPEARVGYLTACGRAYIKTRNLQASEMLLKKARHELRGAADPNRYSVALWAAYLQWNRREYDPASPDLMLAVRAPDPSIQIRALNLQAWMHGGREDYRALLEGLLTCLRFYKQHGDRCLVSIAAESLRSAADLVWEMHDFEAAPLVHEVFRAVPWTSEIRAQRYATVRALSWHAFLNGDAAAAKDLFIEAKALACTRAWEVTAAVDAAHVSSLAGDELVGSKELHDAQTLADSVDWEATREEERMALITLASLLASYDLRSAQRYIDVHYRLQAHSLLENMANTHEPARLQAYRKYADGQIAAVRGNKALAVRLLSDAYNIFARGFVFRATLSARALYELTDDEAWLETARRHAETFPNCVINLTLKPNFTESSRNQP